MFDMLLKEYSDDQARDDHGQWTSTGRSFYKDSKGRQVALTSYKNSKTGGSVEVHAGPGMVEIVQKSAVLGHGSVSQHSTQTAADKLNSMGIKHHFVTGAGGATGEENHSFGIKAGDRVRDSRGGFHHVKSVTGGVLTTDRGMQLNARHVTKH